MDLESGQGALPWRNGDRRSTAREHLWELVRKLHPHAEINQNRWMLIHQDLLEEGKIEKLASAFRSIETSNTELAEKIRIETELF